ncbi:MAG: L-threonylcarbamoyladenylate synthase [Deltaproteobacteria bacterium]|nr:L-threonylcarbamoyladenylate synthase [Deltaproteobacteria bacterium]
MSEVVSIHPENPEPEKIERVVSALREGAIVAYPTETFYGLGVNIENEQAIKHLFDLKRRDYSNPISVIVSDRSMLVRYVSEIPDKALLLMDRFWPGPLTILFRTTKAVSKSLTTNTGKIGIRISSNPVAQALVSKLGAPLTTTSANLSGLPPSFNLKHLKNYFSDKISFVVDAGELPPSVGSTVVDVSEDKLTIIREGLIRSEVLFPYFEEIEDEE